MSLPPYDCTIFLKKSIFEKIPVFYPDKSNFIHLSMDFFKILDFFTTLVCVHVHVHVVTYLHSVVAGVADENESFAIEKDSTRVFELAVERSFASDRLLMLTRWREYLNALKTNKTK